VLEHVIAPFQHVIYLFKGMVASSVLNVAQIESTASSNKYFSVLFSRD